MPRSKISFMSLPPEVRNQIYDLTIEDPASHDVYNRNPPLGLLHLNSLVRREYMAFFYNTHIFHLHTHPQISVDNALTSNDLVLFKGLEPIVLHSLRELMLHVHSDVLLASAFTPKSDRFKSLLNIISHARNLEVLHLNSCGRYARSLSHLIECCVPLHLFPKLLLLVIHTDRQQYANYIRQKAGAFKDDLEWWKHESESLARCKECRRAHLVEVTWRVITKTKSGSASEEKQRLMKVWELLSTRASHFYEIPMLTDYWF